MVVRGFVGKSGSVVSGEDCSVWLQCFAPAETDIPYGLPELELG